MDMSKDGPVDGAQSIRRALAVLRVLAAGQWQGLRLTEVVDESGLSIGTAHRILKALADEGVVERHVKTRRYRIGEELAVLALARGHRPLMATAAEPYLRAISEATGETSFLTIRHRLDSVCIDRSIGNRSVKLLSLDVGARRPLGFGISGLVLLAYMPTEEAETIVARNQRRLALHGFEAASVLEQVRNVRVNGYAYTESGVVRGSRSVSVPVLDPAGRAVAAISVGTVQARLAKARVPTLVQLMSVQAQELSRRLEQSRDDGNWRAS